MNCLLYKALFLYGFISTNSLFAQQMIPLWPDGVPNSKPSNEEERREVGDDGIVRFYNVQDPQIAVYPAPAENNTGVAVIICPGGGYLREVWVGEGTDAAEWLNSIGVTGIVLKYRLPISTNVAVGHEAPLQDAARAIRLVRSRAAEWGIQPNKIGIMGFSAGGHLAATAATHFDSGDAHAKDPLERLSSRPDFAMLVYPVITMRDDFTHPGSRKNLLGENPSAELVDYFSNELQVTADTPPTFLVHGDDDASVPVENSVNFYRALREHGVPAELHVYQHGRHGFGIKRYPGPALSWTERAADWLKTLSHIRVANIFGDGMVLQRDIEVPLWGWGDTAADVEIEILGKTFWTKVDASGRWGIRLAPTPAGGPHTLSIKGKANEIQLRDILFGDVWVCGGQSNMEWPVDRTANSEEEIATANWPEIRLFNVARKMTTRPESDVTPAQWKKAVGENIGDFSAVGYFFGRQLHQDLKVPIGLISDNWGGTVAETWMSPEALKRLPDFEAQVAEAENDPRSAGQILRELDAARLTWETTIADKDQGLQIGIPIWAQPEFDDGNWPEMTLPGYWENAGLADLDGIVWLRKTVELTAAQVGAPSRLNLGRIDDSDEVWFNGARVGGFDYQYNRLRSYEVPGVLIQTGNNVIAIRVRDVGGNGGVWGEPSQLALENIVDGFSLSLAGPWRYQIGAKFDQAIPRGFRPNDRTSLLYHGMIKPIIPYGIKGVIWYQGESNASRAHQYRTLFPALIEDWRAGWGQGDFPFLFVQLANYMAAKPEPGESAWAELREAQSMTLKTPNTGMAVIIDIGEANDIHPRNKQDVGKRLAAAAKKVAYGMNIVGYGPMYDAMQIDGDRIHIRFTNVGSGLVAKDRYGYLKGFAIAGEDRKFHWASAEIDGESVVVHSPQVSQPVAVRYAWADNPDDANLCNNEGLPASPFRTDDWPGVTGGEK